MKAKEPSQRSSKPQNNLPYFKKESNAITQRKPFFSGSLQSKLTIGQPNDKHEQEADRIADRVMRVPENSPIQRRCKECEEEDRLQRKPLASRITPFIQRQSGQNSGLEDEEEKVQTKPLVQRQEMDDEEGIQRKTQVSEVTLLVQRQEQGALDEEEEMIQTKSEGGVPIVTSSFQNQLDASKGGGSPLPKSTNQFMSNAFGTDFSHVRVHDGTQANKMNQSIQAKAFTHGSDIYFKKGQYNLGTSEGNHLLAHELTHVVQQRGNEIDRSIAKQPYGLTITSVTLVPGQSGISYIQRTLDVVAAITYNQNALGGNDQFIQYLKQLLNRSTGTHLPINGTINEAFVRAVASYQQLRRLPQPHDGKIGSRTRRAFASDMRALLPGPRVGASPRAYQAAQNIVNTYMNEKILFAWWAGDCRDNNKNNRVDSDDPVERRMGDGQPSPNRTFRGFKTKAGTCRTPTGRTLTTVDYNTDTLVKYKVCADIVSQAYMRAGIMSSTTRSVVRILSHFQRSRHCNVWRHGAPGFPSKYLPGDFICTASGGHGHAGIVIREESTNSGAQKPVVVHLPGSSLQIDRGQYDPTRSSDIRMERWPAQRWLPSYLYLGRSRR